MPMFSASHKNVNSRAKFPCSLPTLSIDLKSFMKSCDKDPKNTDTQNLEKSKARWDETRGLLQQALVDWESSEKKAEEALKSAETQKTYIDDLMKQLKAKLDEFST